MSSTDKRAQSMPHLEPKQSFPSTAVSTSIPESVYSTFDPAKSPKSLSLSLSLVSLSVAFLALGGVLARRLLVVEVDKELVVRGCVSSVRVAATETRPTLTTARVESSILKIVPSTHIMIRTRCTANHMLNHVKARFPQFVHIALLIYKGNFTADSKLVDVGVQRCSAVVVNQDKAAAANPENSSVLWSESDQRPFRFYLYLSFQRLCCLGLSLTLLLLVLQHRLWRC